MCVCVRERERVCVCVCVFKNKTKNTPFVCIIISYRHPEALRSDGRNAWRLNVEVHTYC